jgi:hypothetical protein
MTTVRTEAMWKPNAAAVHRILNPDLGLWVRASSEIAEQVLLIP